MLIKFTRGGRGSGRQIENYLTNINGIEREHTPPEVVRGDMARTRDLIDSISRKWTYTHGVLSFALEDAPTKEQQLEAMNDFERLAFAGMDPQQYDITWVKHQHTSGGRIELHFVAPRMELTTGKALNIAPPGWEQSYAPLRDALNWQHGWARPDDPRRATELQGATERHKEGLTLRASREGVHAYLVALIASETITDRHTMVRALEDVGLQVTRQGQDYLTVHDPESGEKFRMKGRIYEKEWCYDRELDRALAEQAREPNSRDRDIDLERAEKARIEVEAAIRSRAQHNAERYHRGHFEAGSTDSNRNQDRAMVVDSVESDLVDDRSLFRLAIDAVSLPSNADISEPGSDIPDTAGWGRGDNLHTGRLSVLVREAAGGAIDHGSINSLRARLARTVRDVGERFRDRTGRIRENIRSVARSVREYAQTLGSDRTKATRDRELSASVDSILEREERTIGELANTSERIAQRVEDINREDPRYLSLDFPDPKPSWAR